MRETSGDKIKNKTHNQRIENVALRVLLMHNMLKMVNGHVSAFGKTNWRSRKEVCGFYSRIQGWCEEEGWGGAVVVKHLELERKHMKSISPSLPPSVSPSLLPPSSPTFPCVTSEKWASVARGPSPAARVLTELLEHMASLRASSPPLAGWTHRRFA